MDQNNVYIIDEMMGTGKSCAAINYINASVDERFIVITPYLDEVRRYKSLCAEKHFRAPISRDGSKLKDVKSLIKNGENIVCTHALFQRFDQEVVSLCSILEYTLILDEVAEVVQEYDITPDDIKNLLNTYCVVDESGQLTWRDDQQSYEGKFSDIKNLCNLGGMAIVRNNALMRLFPIDIFNVFKTTYVLTYMFDVQLQRYYYDYHGVSYSKKYVVGDSVDTYTFSDIPEEKHCDYGSLIHVYEDEKMNMIGRNEYALSKSWYERYKDTAIMGQLKNHVSNFFRNKRNDISKDNIWTTFKDYEGKLSGGGYARGSIAMNARATNEYRERTSLAYMVNRYLQPMIKGFFQDHGIEVDEDGYALSEMLQWIWRSAIRDGKEIWIYIPSLRMRTLLYGWIEENS